MTFLQTVGSVVTSCHGNHHLPIHTFPQKQYKRRLGAKMRLVVAIYGFISCVLAAHKLVLFTLCFDLTNKIKIFFLNKVPLDSCD